MGHRKNLSPDRILSRQLPDGLMAQLVAGTAEGGGGLVGLYLCHLFCWDLFSRLGSRWRTKISQKKDETLTLINVCLNWPDILALPL